MKRPLLILILLFVNLQLAYSQDNFKLSIIKGSDTPNSEKVHHYLLQVENNTNDTQTYTINVEDIICKNDNHKAHSGFKFEFYDTSKKKQLKNITVAPKQKAQFYVKTTAFANAKLSTWNCSNVFLYSSSSKEKQLVNIVSFIQDPKNVN